MRTAVLVKGVLGLVLLSVVVWTGVSLRSKADYFIGYDFLAFYTSGRILNEYGPTRLYDLDLQRALHQGVEPSADRRPLWPFLNLPFVAIFFAPLARLPVKEAYFVWMIVNLTLLVATMLIMAWKPGPRGEGGSSPRSIRENLRMNFGSSTAIEVKLLCIVGALALAPTAWGLANGQLTFLVMLVIALFFKDLLNRRDRRAGVWLGFLLIKQQLLVAPLFLLAFKRGWRTLTAALVVMLTLLLLSLGMVGMDGLSAYLNIMRMGVTNDPSVSFFAQSQHNWRGLFLRYGLEGGPLLLATSLASAATLGLLLYSWRGAWRPDALRLTALVLATLIVAPHCHWQEWALLAIVLSLFVCDPEEWGEERGAALRRVEKTHTGGSDLASGDPPLRTEDWVVVFSVAIFTTLAANVFTFWQFSLAHAGAVVALIIIAGRSSRLRAVGGRY